MWMMQTVWAIMHVVFASPPFILSFSTCYGQREVRISVLCIVWIANSWVMQEFYQRLFAFTVPFMCCHLIKNWDIFRFWSETWRRWCMSSKTWRCLFLWTCAAHLYPHSRPTFLVSIAHPLILPLQVLFIMSCINLSNSIGTLTSP